MVSRIKQFTSYYAVLHFLVSIILVVIVALSIGGYLFLKKKYMEDRFSQINLSLATTISNVTQQIHFKQHIAERIAQTDEILQFLKDQTGATQLSSEFQKKIADFTPATMILSAQHKPLFVSDKKLMAYAADSTFQESVQRSMILFSSDVSNVVIDPETSTPHLFITTPIISDNSFLGTLAVELELSSLTRFITDYKDLGTTGEIIVTQKIDSSIVTIFPTRFNHQAPFTPLATTKKDYYATFHHLANGQKGTLITQDDKGQNSLLSWQYMPLTQWGFTVKQSYSEAIKPLLRIKIFLAIIGALAALCILYFLYKSWLHARTTMPLDKIFANALLAFLYIVFIFNTVLLVLYLTNYYYEHKALQHKDALAFKGALQKAAQMVDYRIASIEAVANSLALDISHDALAPTAIAATMQQIMRENPDISAIMYARNNHDHWELAHCALQQDKPCTITATEQEQASAWLQNVLDNQASWLYLQNPLLGQSAPVYGVAFYDQHDFEQKNPLGLIALAYNQEKLINLAQEKIGIFPIMLILGNGTVIFQDQAISLKLATINIGHNKVKNLYLEKITHLGWYLASMSHGIKYTAMQLLLLLLKLILLICSMAIVLHSFLNYTISTQNYKKNNRRLAYACLVAALLTTLFYLVNIFVK